jgi:hypothetical protein
VDEKPKYLTTEFWLALIASLFSIALTLGLIGQAEAVAWQEMLAGFVTAVLPIIALILGYSKARAIKVWNGVVTSDVPGYLTYEFWMTVGTTVLMVLASLRIITQEQQTQFLDLLGPLLSAVLTIVAYVWGRGEVKEARVIMALDKAMTRDSNSE